MNAVLQDRPNPKSCAPGTQIAYAPELVQKLLGDHQKLLGIFERVQAAVRDREISALKASMGDFTSELNAHILLENIRLYVFLKHRLAGDPGQGAAVAKFRKEMGGIAVDVMDFVRHYQSIEFWTNRTWATLEADLGALGEVLGNRIADEEKSLYPLYQPIEI